MSRIGNMPVVIPQGVTVELLDKDVKVSGSLGNLGMRIPNGVIVEISDQNILVKRVSDEGSVRALHGLVRSLISNMVLGVSKGWERKLELVGVGYRAQSSGDKLTLSVGFSHPVEISAPDGVKFSVSDNTKVTVTGFDKALVGQTAAKIRSVKPPEPYQGKGIRFAGEYVRRKAGKAGKVGSGATAK